MKPKAKAKPVKQPNEPVRLEFNHPTAKSVFIAGTFNDWRPDATPMFCVGGGRWIKDVTLAPGAYEYRLVVDGKWQHDPTCQQNAPNPFGGVNSVLTIKASPKDSRESRKGAEEFARIGAARIARSTPPQILSANRI